MKKHSKAWKIAVVAAALLAPAGITPMFDNAAAAPACLSCHQDTYENAMTEFSVHLPFYQENCTVCHIDDAASQSSALGRNDRAVLTENASPGQLKWLGKSSSPLAEHWFVVPADSINGFLYVETRDSGNTPSRSRLELATGMPEVSDDRTPPTIMDLKVHKIERGIYIAATIGWRTDEVADSSVIYGTGQRNASSYDDQFTKSHQVTIVGLKANTLYTVAAVSEDIFGNRTESAPIVLSTADATVEPQTGDSAEDKSAEPLRFTKQIVKAQDNYVVKVSASRPTHMAIGTHLRGQNTGPDRSVDRASRIRSNRGHGSMKTSATETVALCLSCHRNYNGPSSHPVNISLQPDMLAAADYPLSSEGKITCLTCHNPHAAALKNLLRKSAERQLCIGCHRDKSGTPPDGTYITLRDMHNDQS